MVKVVFVCLGNICRSPSGEGVFKDLIEKKGLKDSFFIDSAGTSAYHVGERADARMRQHAGRRNIELTSRARQFVKDDFDAFDYIIAMDRDNFRNINALDRKGQYQEKVFMMTDFSDLYKGRDVPDPYYGGPQGFDTVLDIIEESSEGLLAKIRADHGF